MNRKKNDGTFGKIPTDATPEAANPPEEAQASPEQADQPQPGSSSAAEESQPSPDQADQPQPGLDSARHSAVQLASEKADGLRRLRIPMSMARCLGLDDLTGEAGAVIYLEQFIERAGNPSDPIELMLLQQLAMAHFRIADLHARSAETKNLDAIKMYTSMAARLLGEFRRTALTVRVLQSRVPGDSVAMTAKLKKLA